MLAVHAKWKDGRVVVDEAVDWPEGCELEVRPVAVNGSERDDVESNDPAAIARWIAEFQAVPPLEMTAEEEAEWQAARQAQRELELKTFAQRELKALRPEYDLQQLQGGVRGKYYQRYQSRLHLVRLEPEVAAAFPTEEAVNHALRMLLNLARQEAATPAS